MGGSAPERIGSLRILAIAVLTLTFFGDYGFDAFAKPIPWHFYAGLGSIAIGIEMKSLRNALLTFVQNWAGGAGGEKK